MAKHIPYNKTIYKTDSYFIFIYTPSLFASEHQKHSAQAAKHMACEPILVKAWTAVDTADGNEA